MSAFFSTCRLSAPHLCLFYHSPILWVEILPLDAMEGLVNEPGVPNI